MPRFRRFGDLPAGVYDEVVSRALAARLASLGPGQVDTREVRDDTEIDEQLITLVRDAARIAIGARKRAGDKLAVASRLLERLASEGEAFREGELELEPRLLRRINRRIHGQACPWIR
ncbi:MAG: hypothetical protein FJ096_22260, partial [Deltaproteobacteria bacterium]|nr:hypothetical protein [Deltaproteobacteria bacterium]